MALTAPELRMTGGTPDRLVMLVDLAAEETRGLAIDAVHRARQRMPRVTGATARRLEPYSGEGWFGIWFPDRHVWYQEHGTAPRTMRSLAGKTIPMWITDVDGSLRRENKKAKTRRTEDGRVQVLIFRKAARHGQRKLNRKLTPSGTLVTWTTPMSYPGAPGRIARRQPGSPWTPGGARGGAIAPGNSGVRWRHPGLRATQDLNSALAEAAFDAGLGIEPVYAVDGPSFELLRQRRSV